MEQFPVFLWIVLIPILAAPVIYIGGRVDSRHAAWGLALAALTGAYVPLVLYLANPQLQGTVFGLGAISLHADGIGMLLAAVTLTLGILVIVYSRTYMARDHGQEKYYALLVALIGVIIALGFASDLFNLWVWFEAMAVCSFLLVAFYHEQTGSLEAGLKYLVQSAVGSILVLIGIALVFAQTGTVDLITMHQRVEHTPLLLGAGALLVIGFGVKAALVPLHTWLPDAHSQAPSGISAMLSGVVIEAGLIALLRTLGGMANVTPSWGLVLMGFAALNMLVGNLMALRQTQVKRLLAYSSLSHVGYMLLGLGIALYAGQLDGARGAFFHLVTHGLMKGLAFLAAGALLYALHIALGSHDALTIRDLSGAARRYPLAALALSLAVLGLGGLPPLAGFMSKWQIFAAGFAAGNGWIDGLVIFAALNSLLSLAYYTPLINAMYRHEESPAVQSGSALPFTMRVPLAALSLAILVIGIWPTLIQWLTGPAGSALLSAFGAPAIGR